MQYFPLIWSGLWRKRLRTILTFLSIVIALLPAIPAAKLQVAIALRAVV